MWSASFNLGNFVGPTASGFFVESLGFRTSTMIFFALYIVMGIADTLEMIHTLRNHNKKTEYQSMT